MYASRRIPLVFPYSRISFSYGPWALPIRRCTATVVQADEVPLCSDLPLSRVGADDDDVGYSSSLLFRDRMVCLMLLLE